MVTSEMKARRGRGLPEEADMDAAMLQGIGAIGALMLAQLALFGGLLRWQLSTLEKRIDRMEGDIREVRASNERAIESLRTSNEQAIENLRASNEQAIESLRTSNERAIESLRASNEQAIESLRTDLKSDMARLEARLIGGSASGGAAVTVSNPE